MADIDPLQPVGIERKEWFGTTSWSNLARAQGENEAQSRAALETLCQSYWYPLYVYVRRRGYKAEDAEDLTQAFFFQVLEKNYLGAVDRRKGKFRSFLLAALNHFLSNERDYRQAAKRGGGSKLISLDEQAAEDRYQLEPATDVSPETLFEQRWARTVVDQARHALEQEYREAGKSELFHALQPFLSEVAGSGDYSEVARALSMSPSAIAVAVHRMRQRFGDVIRGEISRTVARPSDIEPELRHLFEVLQTAPQ